MKSDSESCSKKLCCRYRLVDFDADSSDRICVDHLVNFGAVSDYYEVEVYWRTRIPGNVDHSDAGAIRIYGISPAAWPPLLGWREAASYEMIHLGQVTSTIVA